MNETNNNKPSVKTHELDDKKCCPECGEKMVEVERHKEYATLCVWYGCSKPNCNGQWLEELR